MEGKGSWIAMQCKTETATLKVSIYLVSNYIIKPQWKSQHNSTHTKKIDTQKDGIHCRTGSNCTELQSSKFQQTWENIHWKKKSSNKWRRKAAVVICVFSRMPITLLKRSSVSQLFAYHICSLSYTLAWSVIINWLLSYAISKNYIFSTSLVM